MTRFDVSSQTRLLYYTSLDSFINNHVYRAFLASCLLPTFLDLSSGLEGFLPPGTPAFSFESVFGMCVKPSQHPPHPLPQPLKWLLARPRIHGIFPEVVEQDAVDDDEAYETPLHHLGPLVPHGLD